MPVDPVRFPDIAERLGSVFRWLLIAKVSAIFVECIERAQSR